MDRRFLLAFALGLLTGCQTSPASTTRPVGGPQPGGGEIATEHQDEAVTAPDAAGGDQDGGRPDALGFVHDQLMVKLKSALSADELRGLVESSTGAAVASVRAGPVGLRLLVFVPSHPPRTADDLLALKEKLEATDAFEYVQPNRLYEAKAESGE